MKKLLFAAIMAAIMFSSVFVGLKSLNVNATITNGMAMNPTVKVVNPPEGGSDLTFLYPINITTTVANVSAWEAKLHWDPAVLRPITVVWGTFMTGGVTTNSITMSSGGDWILLGQNFNTQVFGITGSGTLATINFTFVLPGATFVAFTEAKVYDDALTAYDLLAGSVDGRVTSTMPHPSFTWVSADGPTYNPLPSKTIYDGGRTTYNQGVAVNFTSTSYDVTNMVWNGTAFNLVGGANIVALLWQYADGKSDYYSVAGGNYSTKAQHMYAAYNQAGWVVNLTAWNGAGGYWSSTWRYQGPDPANTVPMWRDVAIVDIWPSLIPFDEWANGTGSSWYSPWWFDTSDFVIPNTASPYWNYQMPDDWCDSYGIAHGTTVKQAYALVGPQMGDEGPGLMVLVTGNNFGDVPEKVLINLYAIGTALKTAGSPPLFSPVYIDTVEQIGTWTKTLSPHLGTGLSGCFTNWMPSKNATYYLFATIDIQDGAAGQDQDRSNNYFLMGTPITNIANWNFTSGSMEPLGYTNNAYLCDLNSPTYGSDGKVTGADLNFLLANFGSNSKNSGYSIPISKP